MSRNAILFAMTIGVWVIAGRLEQLTDSTKERAKPPEPETVTMRCSAYCACEECCPGTSDNVTANGHKIKPGEKFVAADKRYRFGTMLTIPGYNDGRPVPVLDRGGAIKGDKIDVFFDDDVKNGLTGHEKALQWGVKYLKVVVYEKE